MPDEPAATPDARSVANGGRRTNGGDAELAALRRLLVGPEQVRLEQLEELKDRKITAADIAEHLPEAITLRGQRDSQVGLGVRPRAGRRGAPRGAPRPGGHRNGDLPDPRPGYPEVDCRIAVRARPLDQHRDGPRVHAAGTQVATGGQAYWRAVRADRPQALAGVPRRAGVPH